MKAVMNASIELVGFNASKKVKNQCSNLNERVLHLVY